MTPLLILGLLAGLAFVGLTLSLSRSKRFLIIDRRLQRRFFAKPGQTKASRFLSTIFAPKMMVIWDFLLAAFLIGQGRNLAALWALASLALADGCGLLVKHLVKRQRPFNRGGDQAGWSFPSGHLLGTTTMILIVWTLFGQHWSGGVLAGLLILGLIMAFARLEAGAHYPADLLGAVFLALTCFAISDALWLAL